MNISGQFSDLSGPQIALTIDSVSIMHKYDRMSQSTKIFATSTVIIFIRKLRP